MSDVMRQILEVIMERPLSTLGCVIVAILYVQLMAGPRVR